MISSNAFKNLLAVFLVLVTLSACRFWQSSENEQANSNTFVADELKSEIPFTLKEPEKYQAEIVLINYNNGEKSERKTSVARSGAKIRYDYPGKISFLQANENERYLIDTEKKIYTKSYTNTDKIEQNGETLKDFLTTEWLNEKHDAKFENLGEDNGLTKYRVVMNSAENVNSEVLIYVDEELKMPVKQEFFTVDGDKKTPLYSMEIRDLKLEADEQRFVLTEEFKQVTIKEFQENIWKKKFLGK